MNSGTPNLVLHYSFAPNFGEMVWVGVEFYIILMKWCKNWCGLEMLEVVEMVVYPTSLDHLLDKSLSSSGPSPDCHVTRNVSHSSCNSNCIVIYI